MHLDQRNSHHQQRGAQNPPRSAGVGAIRQWTAPSVSREGVRSTTSMSGLQYQQEQQQRRQQQLHKQGQQELQTERDTTVRAEAPTTSSLPPLSVLPQIPKSRGRTASRSRIQSQGGMSDWSETDLQVELLDPGKVAAVRSAFRRADVDQSGAVGLENIEQILYALPPAGENRPGSRSGSRPGSRGGGSRPGSRGGGSRPGSRGADGGVISRPSSSSFAEQQSLAHAIARREPTEEDVEAARIVVSDYRTRRAISQINSDDMVGGLSINLKQENSKVKFSEVLVMA